MQQADIITQQKKELRRHIRSIKAAWSPMQLQQMSTGACQRIYKRIQDMAEAKSRKTLTVLLYWSLPDEVYTHELVLQLMEQGHRILLPSVVGENLELHVMQGSTLMHSGDYGIMEAEGELFADYGCIDLAVIPGMAFTAGGKRLGRGKGFYDKLLPRLSCIKAGLAFPFQIVEDIPCHPHDILMDEVIF